MAAYLHDIWRCRYFWLSLVKLDLRTRYRGSGLGVGWSLLRPLAMTAILCVVFHQLFEADIREYCPYLLIGLAGWNFLSSVTLEGCASLLLADAFIRQHRAPLAIYPLRAALGAAAHLSLALAAVLFLLICFRGFGHPLPLLSLAPGLLLLFLFGWSSATIVALVNVHFRDTQHLCDVGLQMLFYLTPVIYPPAMLRQRGLGWLVNYNPLACFLDVLRAPLLENRVPSAASFGVVALAVAVTGGVAVLMLQRLQRRVVFYL
jgi:ABC-type polysaccharide/polyol phosphate export permease